RRHTSFPRDWSSDVCSSDLVPAAVAAQEAPPAAQQAALPADSTILRVIRERVDAGRNKGIVVGVLDPDGRTRVVAYGDPGAGQADRKGVAEGERGGTRRGWV